MLCDSPIALLTIQSHASSAHSRSISLALHTLVSGKTDASFGGFAHLWLTRRTTKATTRRSKPPSVLHACTQNTTRHQSIGEYRPKILDNDSVAASSVINIIVATFSPLPRPTLPWSRIFLSTPTRVPSISRASPANEPEHISRISFTNRQRYCFHLQDDARIQQGSFAFIPQGPNTRSRPLTAYGDHFPRSDASPHKSKRRFRCSRSQDGNARGCHL